VRRRRSVAGITGGCPHSAFGWLRSLAEVRAWGRRRLAARVHDDLAAQRLLAVECLAKNIVLALVLWSMLPAVGTAVEDMPARMQGNVLTTASLLLAGAVAGRFAFSYGRTNLHSFTDRLLGHLTTLLLSFGTGLLLALVMATMNLSPHPSNAYLFVASASVYASLVLCDFWDALRVAHGKA
jgi:hypothetical protein